MVRFIIRDTEIIKAISLYLHSNMVRFIIGLYPIAWLECVPFTFQYG